LYGNPEKIVYKNFWENLVFIGMDEFHKKYITFLTYALEVVDECIISIEDVKWVEEYTSYDGERIEERIEYKKNRDTVKDLSI
jgi:hypothetical protein